MRFRLAILVLLAPLAAFAQLAPGTDAPALDLRDLTGHKWQTKGLQEDRLYLMKWWATWCGTCKKIAPIVDEAAKQNKERVTYLSVSIDTEVPDLIRYVQAKKPDHTLLFDPDLAAAERWKAGAVPVLYLVRNGKVLWANVGDVTKVKMDQAISDALERSR